MKLKIFIVLVAVVVAWVAGRSIKSDGHSFVGTAHEEAQGTHGASGAHDAVAPDGANERRINQSFQLADGAKVDVHGINGPVSIEAVDGDTAEVNVTSTAAKARDLDTSGIMIEHTETSLVVRGKGSNGGFWKWLRGGEVRHNVVLKLPRSVELAVRGTNGKVSIGEMEGAVHVSGVNGRVEIGQAHGFAEVSGVNGAVALTIRELGAEGVQVSGVNGKVEIRVGGDVDADLNIEGVNGKMSVEAPNVEIEEQKRSKLRAKIGSGGANIQVNGINGGVSVVGV